MVVQRLSTPSDATRPARILLFIPAFNCAPQVGRVVAQLTPEVAALFAAVVVVDNRSTDGTAAAAERALVATLPPGRFALIRNRENNGLGGSHKVAFDIALAGGFTHLAVLHGDDQGSIADLVPFLRDGSFEALDCLLGGRFMPGSRLEGYSGFRTNMNRLCNLLFSCITFRRVRDLGAGLNLYRVAAFRDRAYLFWPNSLSFNQVALLYSIASRHRIRFFPLSWREADQVSNVRLGRMGVQLARNVLLFVFDRRGLLHRDRAGLADRDYGFDVVAGQALDPPATSGGSTVASPKEPVHAAG